MPDSLVALTRAVSPAITRCELTHLARDPIDFHRAEGQHDGYERLLGELGCRVQRVPADPGLADAVFIEDTAVVVDEVAVVTRPGAASRRPETALVEQALQAYRPVLRIEAPGTLDGGDVLQVGRTLFVGQSSRTNASGTDQLARALAPFGYSVRPVRVRGCLHLKTAVTALSDRAVVLNPAWADAADYAAFDVVQVDPAEPFAANVVRVGPTLIHAEAFPRTRARIEAQGYRVRPVDLSELAKAEGAVTCCSLLLRA